MTADERIERLEAAFATLAVAFTRQYPLMRVPGNARGVAACHEICDEQAAREAQVAGTAA